MRKKKAITLDHIAEKSGLSKVTVSKALNNRDGVSEEVKEKVRSVANEIGYKFTKPKSHEKTKNVGILIHQKYISDSGSSTFYLRFYQELTIKLNNLGYICNLFTITPQDDIDQQLPAMFSEATLCGIVCIGNMDKEYVNLLAKIQVPSVFLDCYHADEKVDCVATDHYTSTYDITIYLMKMGHEQVGFVGATYAPVIQDRLLGYCRAIMESGCDIDKELIVMDRDKDNQEIDMVLPIQMPTAFVCNGDDVAYKFVQNLKAQGYSVPEDVSVVGFDNDIYAEICTPKLTTVAVDREAMTTKAVDMLVKKMRGEYEVKKHRTLFIPGHVVYRESVRPLK